MRLSHKLNTTKFSLIKTYFTGIYTPAMRGYNATYKILFG